MDAKTELTFEHIMLNERSQTPKATYCIIPLFEISRTQKSIETRLAVAWGWGWEEFGSAGIFGERLWICSVIREW